MDLTCRGAINRAPTIIFNPTFLFPQVTVAVIHNIGIMCKRGGFVRHRVLIAKNKGSEGFNLPEDFDGRAAILHIRMQGGGFFI